MRHVCFSAPQQSLGSLWKQAALFLQFETGSDRYLSTIGLVNGTVYDLLGPGMENQEMAQVVVNASTANITCGGIPNTTITQYDYGISVVESVFETYRFCFAAMTNISGKVRCALFYCMPHH